MLISGLVLLVLFVAFRAVVKPAMDRLETLKRVIPEKQNALRQLRAKSEEYLALHNELSRVRGRIASQQDDFGVLSFLERVQNECGLARNVAYMKPVITTSADNAYVETRVEIKLENVSLQQITQFLLRIETEKALVGVKALHIRTAAKAARSLEAVVQIVTVAPGGRG